MVNFDFFDFDYDCDLIDVIVMIVSIRWRIWFWFGSFSVLLVLRFGCFCLASCSLFFCQLQAERRLGQAGVHAAAGGTARQKCARLQRLVHRRRWRRSLCLDWKEGGPNIQLRIFFFFPGLFVVV